MTKAKKKTILRAMARGNKRSLFYDPIPTRIDTSQLDNLQKIPRIEKLATDAKSLGLEEYIEFDEWSGGHYWIAKGSLDQELKSGKELEAKNPFRSLVSRAKSHRAAQGLYTKAEIAEETGKDEERVWRKISGKFSMLVNAEYLEKAIRVTGGDRYRWHTIKLDGRLMAVAYKEDEPVILIAELA